MNIKALYPSMTWDDIVEAVMVLIENSKMVIDDVNWREFGKYVAVFVPDEVIEAHGLRNVVPRNNCQPGRTRTINFLQSEKNDSKWTENRAAGCTIMNSILFRQRLWESFPTSFVGTPA